jgi:hypothetical protein
MSGTAFHSHVRMPINSVQDCPLLSGTLFHSLETVSLDWEDFANEIRNVPLKLEDTSINFG